MAKSRPEQVLPHLVRMFGDSEVIVRWQVAEALGEVAKARPDQVLSHLIPLIGGSDARVRREVAHSLGEVAKSRPEDALKHLIPMIGDSDAHVRSQVAWALGEVAKARPDQVSGHLIRMIGDSDAGVRERVAHALGEVAKTHNGSIAIDEMLKQRMMMPGTRRALVASMESAYEDHSYKYDSSLRDRLIKAKGNESEEIRILNEIRNAKYKSEATLLAVSEYLGQGRSGRRTWSRNIENTPELRSVAAGILGQEIVASITPEALVNIQRRIQSAHDAVPEAPAAAGVVYRSVHQEESEEILNQRRIKNALATAINNVQTYANEVAQRKLNEQLAQQNLAKKMTSAPTPTAPHQSPELAAAHLPNPPPVDTGYVHPNPNFTVLPEQAPTGVRIGDTRGHAGLGYSADENHHEVEASNASLVECVKKSLD